MSTTYPISDQRTLSPAERARWFNRRKLNAAELPRPAAFQSLVYRVNGDYVKDDDRRKPVDGSIVDATSVCVVDMRRDAPVTVSLEIPSRDAGNFEVSVTFLCTVKDPIVVVRGGIDAGQALTGHLKAHNRIFELGLDFPLDEVNEVRRYVGAQVKAYLMIRPAEVAGMKVSFANVEVRTPKPVVDFNERHRDQDYEARLTAAETAHLHRREAGQAQHDHTMQSTALHHEHQLERRRGDFTRQNAVDDVENDLHIQQRRAAVARDEFGRNMAMIDSDPRRALMAAFAQGSIDAGRLSQELAALDERERAALVQRVERERAASLELMAAQREDRRLDHDHDRERNEAEREERRRQADQEREDRLLRERDEREDRIREDQNRRDDEWRRYDSEVEVLKQMTARGHLNTSNVGADRLFARVMRMPDPEVGAAQTAQVDGRRSDPELVAGADTSEGVREEDE